MTDERAIKVLDNILSGYEEYTDHNDVYDACMKGIRTIEKLSKIEEIIHDHDNDRNPEDFWFLDKIREVIMENKQ